MAYHNNYEESLKRYCHICDQPKHPPREEIEFKFYHPSTFKVGQRVKRLTNECLWNPTFEKVWREGFVTKIYRIEGGCWGPYPELYEVQWDDGNVERGFLPYGIEAVYTTMVGCSGHVLVAQLDSAADF